MKEYYIMRGFKLSGPFLLSDLKSLNLGKDVFVWRKGLKDWTPIIDVINNTNEESGLEKENDK